MLLQPSDSSIPTSVVTMFAPPMMTVVVQTVGMILSIIIYLFLWCNVPIKIY